MAMASSDFTLAGDFRDANTYSQLQEMLTLSAAPGNYLYYLATASNFFCDIIWQRLG